MCSRMSQTGGKAFGCGERRGNARVWVGRGSRAGRGDEDEGEVIEGGWG